MPCPREAPLEGHPGRRRCRRRHSYGSAAPCRRDVERLAMPPPSPLRPVSQSVWLSRRPLVASEGARQTVGRPRRVTVTTSTRERERMTVHYQRKRRLPTRCLRRADAAGNGTRARRRGKTPAAPPARRRRPSFNTPSAAPAAPPCTSPRSHRGARRGSLPLNGPPRGNQRRHRSPLRARTRWLQWLAARPRRWRAPVTAQRDARPRWHPHPPSWQMICPPPALRGRVGRRRLWWRRHLCAAATRR